MVNLSALIKSAVNILQAKIIIGEDRWDQWQASFLQSLNAALKAAKAGPQFEAHSWFESRVYYHLVFRDTKAKSNQPFLILCFVDSHVTGQRYEFACAYQSGSAKTVTGARSLGYGSGAVAKDQRGPKVDNSKDLIAMIVDANTGGAKLNEEHFKSVRDYAAAMARSAISFSTFWNSNKARRVADAFDNMGAELATEVSFKGNDMTVTVSAALGGKILTPAAVAEASGLSAQEIKGEFYQMNHMFDFASYVAGKVFNVTNRFIDNGYQTEVYTSAVDKRFPNDKAALQISFRIIRTRSGWFPK